MTPGACHRRRTRRLTHALALASLLLVSACEKPVEPAFDFARCRTREVPMPGASVKFHDCPVKPVVHNVGTLRFVEMEETVANVIALEGERPVVDLPLSLAPVIVGYGAGRYEKLTVLLPPSADVEGWKRAGWMLGPAGSTGLRAVWSR